MYSISFFTNSTQPLLSGTTSDLVLSPFYTPCQNKICSCEQECQLFLYDSALTAISNLPKQSHVVRRQVLGSVVMTKYNQRTYTIHDVAWNITPTSTFNFHGSEITYHDYYQQVITLTWYLLSFCL